ncbi:GNAT family N-acetyltransferase [Phenylobacterium sp.]|uniref:GNAT family N-acetyltransferase n=1 Tax=Phenylobacterium sp. TaxID=1871053 RepID=UPI002730CCA1|nr:GNAT family N-acetyltransferase [Phenylobacterium sp.]MDP1599404.1 GNAT family N-acetyltransferase [Phenylobacterium sp.]MDP3591126.1 GNAT family N-acetyltransferase [Phenylobacterium sp.]
MKPAWPNIETERLTLRCFEPSDATALARNMTPAVTRWLISWPDPMTPQIALQRIERSRAGMARGDRVFYALVRRDDERVIGGLGCGLSPDDPQRMELGYHLAEDCHGFGYMREAACAAAPAFWRFFPAQVMEASAQLSNEASFKTMRALGLTPVGDRIVHAPARGVDETHRVYELRRPETTP